MGKTRLLRDSLLQSEPSLKLRGECLVRGESILRGEPPVNTGANSALPSASQQGGAGAAPAGGYLPQAAPTQTAPNASPRAGSGGIKAEAAPASGEVAEAS